MFEFILRSQTFDCRLWFICSNIFSNLKCCIFLQNVLLFFFLLHKQNKAYFSTIKDFSLTVIKYIKYMNPRVTKGITTFKKILCILPKLFTNYAFFILKKLMCISSDQRGLQSITSKKKYKTSVNGKKTS